MMISKGVGGGINVDSPPHPLPKPKNNSEEKREESVYILVRKETFIVSALSLPQEIPAAPSKNHMSQKCLKVYYKGNQSQKCQTIKLYEGKTFFCERV